MTKAKAKPAAAKPAAKPAGDKRIDAIIAVLKANGISLPKELGK